MPKDVEVEIQTFLSSAEVRRVKSFLQKRAKFLGTHRDSTTYFEGNGRIRIRVEPGKAYFVFKGGRMHDRYRKEIEIPFEKKFIPSAEEFLQAIGFSVVVRWFRKREKWLWKGVTVTLDDSRGYGTILELEKMSSEKEKNRASKELQGRLAILKIKPTGREEMNRHFRYYLKHWRQLV